MTEKVLEADYVYRAKIKDEFVENFQSLFTGVIEENGYYTVLVSGEALLEKYQ